MITAAKVITPQIDKHLLSIEQEQQQKRNDLLVERVKNGQAPMFHPSSISKCSRAIVYEMLGYPPEPRPASFIRIFRNGDSMHERYQAWFKDMGILVATEVAVEDEDLRISGRVDAILDIGLIDPSLGGGNAVAELKSAKAKNFYYMKKTSTPSQTYIEQICLYLHLLKLDKGVIIVECKDDQELLEFWLDYDENLARRLIDKIKFVNLCIDTNQIPLREYQRDSYQCVYCDFRKTCYRT